MLPGPAGRDTEETGSLGKPEPESKRNRTERTHRPGWGHTGGPLGVGSGIRRRDGLGQPSLPDSSAHGGGGSRQPHCVSSCPSECDE